MFPADSRKPGIFFRTVLCFLLSLHSHLQKEMLLNYLVLCCFSAHSWLSLKLQSGGSEQEKDMVRVLMPKVLPTNVFWECKMLAGYMLLQSNLAITLQDPHQPNLCCLCRLKIGTSLQHTLNWSPFRAGPAAPQDEQKCITDGLGWKGPQRWWKSNPPAMVRDTLQ